MNMYGFQGIVMAPFRCMVIVTLVQVTQIFALQKETLQIHGITFTAQGIITITMLFLKR